MMGRVYEMTSEIHLFNSHGLRHAPSALARLKFKIKFILAQIQVGCIRSTSVDLDRLFLE